MHCKFILFTVVVFLCTVVGPVCSQDDTSRYQIVFSTFEKDGAGDYAYLRDSIQAMLASRLAAKDRVSVVEKTFSKSELNALKKPEVLENWTIDGAQVDYLVTGSLFALTGGLNTQVVLYPLIQEKEILRFSIVSETTETIIGDIENLSADIAHRAFGYPDPKSLGGGAEGQEGSDGGFVTAHPEAAYKRGLYSGTIIGYTGSGLQAEARGMKKTTTIPVEMRLMAVGDADGDGEEEIFVVSGQKLTVLAVKDRKIEELMQAPLSPYITRHAVNLADLDGDGRQEIYFSGTDGLYVSSSIMEWSRNGGLQVISEGIPYYLRPLDIPGRGWQLVGQRRGMERADLVRPGLFLLTIGADGKPRLGSQLSLPESLNLFDFTYADLDGDGSHEIIALSQQEKLKVYNAANQLVWVSEKEFGGSKLYFGPSVGGAVDDTNRRNLTPDEDSGRELVFIPGRLLATDVDGDGRSEIIVNENNSSIVGNFFRRLRVFDNSTVVGLTWDGSALRESWRTGNFRGYVAGYGFSLRENQQGGGRQQATNETVQAGGRLYIGNLPKSGSLAELLPGSGETDITVYDLEFSVKNEN